MKKHSQTINNRRVGMGQHTPFRIDSPTQSSWSIDSRSGIITLPRPDTIDHSTASKTAELFCSFPEERIFFSTCKPVASLNVFLVMTLSIFFSSPTIAHQILSMQCLISPCKREGSTNTGAYMQPPLSHV